MYSDDELYKTCKHESFHALRALACGQRVLEIDIAKGQTLLQWCAFPWELPRIVRTDPTYAVELVKGIVGACVVAALAAHETVNQGDEAAYRPFLTSWPRNAPVTRDELHKQACTETRAWLAEPETRRRVLKLSQALFIYRHEAISGETLARVLARVTQPPPAQPVAAPVRPTPAGAARPKRTGLDIQYEWYLSDLEHLSRSRTHAQEYKPHSLYRPSVPRFARLAG